MDKRKVIAGMVIVIFVFLIGLSITLCITIWGGCNANYEDKPKQEQKIEYEPELTISGHMKYLPYWLVSDKWIQMEANGQIEKSSSCADLVTLIRSDLPISDRETFFDIWKRFCILD